MKLLPVSIIKVQKGEFNSDLHHGLQCFMWKQSFRDMQHVSIIYVIFKLKQKGSKESFKSQAMHAGMSENMFIMLL